MSENTVQNKETLSALMDGEASEFELRKILQATTMGSELREQWQRYHLASAILRKESVQKPNLSLCDSILSAIEQEPTHGTSVVKRIAQPLSRFAVAASVAALAVIGVQQYNLTSNSSGTDLVAGNNASDRQETVAPVQFPSAFTVPRVPVRAVSASNNSDYYEPKPVVVLRKIDPTVQLNQEQVEAYLNDVMRKHTENSALNANQGMLPFARMPAGNVEQP